MEIACQYYEGLLQLAKILSEDELLFTLAKLKEVAEDCELLKASSISTIL